MASRCNPIDDIDILRNTWSTWLDPTQNPPEKRPYGSKALINACKEHRHLPVFSKRTTLRRNIYDTVARRWKELGLPGQIPAVRAFEAETKVIYHEVGGFEPGLQPGGQEPRTRRTARKPRKSAG
jgi:4-hydroxy-3-polyprenylbenzoate decarboxylase